MSLSVGNLHRVASGVIPAVNPPVTATLQLSTGTTTTMPDGTEVPNYAPATTVLAQVQALGWRDLQQLDGLNVQGTRRAIYLYGDVQGIVRPTGQGGDLITFPGQVGNFPPGTVWLVALALETWGVGVQGWCKVAATLQNGS